MTRARVPGRFRLHTHSAVSEDSPRHHTTSESHAPDSVPCLQALTEILTLGCVVTDLTKQFIFSYFKYFSGVTG